MNKKLVYIISILSICISMNNVYACLTGMCDECQPEYEKRLRKIEKSLSDIKPEKDFELKDTFK